MHVHTFNVKRERIAIIIALSLLIVGLIFRRELGWGEWIVFGIAYLVAGWKVLLEAARHLLTQPFDENFLMSIATIGAIIIRQLPEAVAVMLFFRVGEYFQGRAVQNSKRSITALLELHPDVANLDDGRQVAPEKVGIGETIVVRPGDRVPLDGEVIEGQSSLDTSALTGESVPKRVNVGESVLAGMINQEGLLRVRVTKPFGESSIAKILDLVQHAGEKKARTERFVTRLARYYTPIVVLGALAVAFLPPLLMGEPLSKWVYRALILLVVSCPCGLVISIPLGYFGGVGGAARKGVLVKGATFLDRLTRLKTVAFDKTGTLTKGSFKVTQIVPYNGFTPDELIAMAAAAESHSTHPIAQSIAAAAPQSHSVSDYQEIPAHGVRATVDGREVMVGNDRLLHREHIAHETCLVEGTVAHVVIEKRYAGYVVISDELKEDSIRAIEELRALGVESITMLTGDSQHVAERIAKELKINTFSAELLPEEKVAAVEMMANPVAFVGDGINDAPVLTRADVGIAMGGLGSDAAIETADVVIMTDAPSKVATAVRISRKTRKIVIENIVLALGIKTIVIGLGAFGVATMWEAIFADVGVALLAILNSTRVLR